MDSARQPHPGPEHGSGSDALQVRTGLGKHPSALTANHTPTTDQALETHLARSISHRTLGKQAAHVEGSVDHRTTRHRVALASRAVQAFLEVQVEAAAKAGQTTVDRRPCRLDQAGGEGEADLGSRAHSGRAAQVRDPGQQ
jgi:hypothetical protein